MSDSPAAGGCRQGDLVLGGEHMKEETIVFIDTDTLTEEEMAHVFDGEKGEVDESEDN